MVQLIVSNRDLDRVAFSATEIKKFSSNVGDIGMAPDFSNNTLRNVMQNEFPLLTWLWNTPLSNQMRNTAGVSNGNVHKDEETGEWMLMLPYTVGTLPPQDTSGSCCWVPFDIAKCGSKAPIRMLCLKDCDDILSNLINQTRRAGGNDLTGTFQNPGETVAAAKKRMARLSMAFLSARNMILGVSTSGTDVLKPFHGLVEVLENPAVIEILGTNILGAFDELGYRLRALGMNGNHVIAVHPFTLLGIEAVVKPGLNGQLPQHWTRNGDNLAFMGISFIPDKLVPVDVTAGTGEAWVIDGASTGIYTGTSLAPSDAFIRESFEHNDKPTEGCAGECTYYYNYGSTFTNNHNQLARIVDIPLHAGVLGNTLQGLEGLIQPTTLVPMD